MQPTTNTNNCTIIILQQLSKKNTPHIKKTILQNNFIQIMQIF